MFSSLGPIQRQSISPPWLLVIWYHTKLVNFVLLCLEVHAYKFLELFTRQRLLWTYQISRTFNGTIFIFVQHRTIITSYCKFWIVMDAQMKTLWHTPQAYTSFFWFIHPKGKLQHFVWTNDMNIQWRNQPWQGKVEQNVKSHLETPQQWLCCMAHQHEQSTCNHHTNTLHAQYQNFKWSTNRN